MGSIWDDEDVQRVFLVQGGTPLLKFDELTPLDQVLMSRFIEADQSADGSTAKALIIACAEGVQVFENVSDPMQHSWAIGWKKFLLYQTGCNVQILWNEFRCAGETAIFADWVTSSIASNKWGPDGNKSALGNLHSNCMAIAAQAGGGVRINPATGRWEAPTGDAARRYNPTIGLA